MTSVLHETCFSSLSAGLYTMVSLLYSVLSITRSVWGHAKASKHLKLRAFHAHSLQLGYKRLYGSRSSFYRWQVSNLLLSSYSLVTVLFCAEYLGRASLLQCVALCPLDVLLTRATEPERPARHIVRLLICSSWSHSEGAYPHSVYAHRIWRCTSVFLSRLTVGKFIDYILI